MRGLYIYASNERNIHNNNPCGTIYIHNLTNSKKKYEHFCLLEGKKILQVEGNVDSHLSINKSTFSAKGSWEKSRF